jgi:hypothetical protein
MAFLCQTEIADVVVPSGRSSLSAETGWCCWALGGLGLSEVVARVVS